MRWVGLVAALALLAAAAPAAHAQTPPAEAPLSFLVYHAPGGRVPDPLASERAAPPVMDRLPTTLFDRAVQAERAPENAPESALAHFRHFQDLLQTRERVPAALELRVEGELVDGALRVRASSNASATLRLVLFEHAVPLAGRPQPYVARTAEDGGEATFALDPVWDRARLGVVAFALVDGGVAQSATWLVGAPPTVQRTRSVLVEHVTASWCDACVPADEAVALLATQRGIAGPLPSGDVRYFREPTFLLYAGLALGAGAAAVVIRRRGA